MSGLYLHIPFCKQACHYCDFHFSTQLERQDDMVEAMIQELTIQKDYLQSPVLSSIYFGGGTPSLLEKGHFEKIFGWIRDLYTLEASCEITLEANPDDLSLENLKLFREFGINRLSIGAQSFDDKILKFLNRAHDGKMALTALSNCRQVGFDNISIDLIYAIPGQDSNSLSKNIETALKFNPEHFSAYSLTIEPKTVFGNWVGRNKLTPTDEDINAEQYELLANHLSKVGYDHYEISNFCLPGFTSKHNSSYWKQEPYLGIGPSAHSYNTKTRQFNIKNNALYINSIQKGIVPYELEVLSRENMINEYLFTTLRTSWGCNLQKLKENYSFDLLHRQSTYLNNLIDKKLASLENDTLVLSFSGRLIADQIAMDLMA